MALGQHGKRRLGVMTSKKHSHDRGGSSPAVGGPRPDSTARWPGNPGRENSAPGSGKYPLVKTFVAGAYMPGNPAGKHKLGKSKAKEILEHGEVRGKKLSKKQKGLFGAIAGGAKLRKR